MSETMTTTALSAPTVLVADIPPISQDQINRFGALLGTHGKIHTDPEFAKSTPLKGVIAQGMLVLAPIHEVMSCIFGAGRWLAGGHLEAKIIAYTRPGEAGRITVEIERSDAAGASGSFTVGKENGDSVLVGTFHLGGAA